MSDITANGWMFKVHDRDCFDVDHLDGRIYIGEGVHILIIFLCYLFELDLLKKNGNSLHLL